MARTLLIPLTSRYKDTQVTQDSTGRTAFGLFRVPDEIEQAREDGPVQTLATVPSSRGRLDLIAATYLGTESAYWTIVYMNDMIDPVEDMEDSDQIAMPSSSPVRQFLNRGPVRRR